MGRMPSSKQVHVKEGCGSERLKGGKEEEGARPGETGVCRMPSIDCWPSRVLTCKYRLLAVLFDRHLACVRKCRFWREQRLATVIDRKGQKRRRPVIQRALARDDNGYRRCSMPNEIAVEACQKRRILPHKPAGPGARLQLQHMPPVTK